MRSHAFITDVTEREIYAMQLVTEACVTCAADCIQRGKPFAVANSRRLAVEKGSIVRIGRSRLTRGIHGFAALGIPVAAATAGLVLATPIAQKIGFESTETFKAVCVMSFLAVSAGIVFALSRSTLHLSKPEILQVL